LSQLKAIAGHKRIATTVDIYVHPGRKHHPVVRRMVQPFVAVPRESQAS
jgi:hypothetical protein